MPLAKLISVKFLPKPREDLLFQQKSLVVRTIYRFFVGIDQTLIYVAVLCNSSRLIVWCAEGLGIAGAAR